MIFNFTDKAVPSLSKIGGKAKALMETTNAGFKVPEGFVLSVNFFDEWLSKIKGSEQFKLVLEKTEKDHCDALKALALDMTLSETQMNMLKSSIDAIDGDWFAVRSSSPEEDLKGTSFAGMYETYLGVKRDDLEKYIVKAFASCFDYRVMLYKVQQSIGLENTSIAIVIQRLIQSDVSGVGFSMNPLNNAYDEVLINASFGLGEAIVSGIVTPDTYVVDTASNNILDKKINHKEIGLFLNQGSVIELQVESPMKSALNEKQIYELTSMIKDCESHYDMPMDLEWAYENGMLYLLQARPITTHLPLFKELLTQPGEPKKFYIDLMILTQGVDESMSVLGLEIWSKMLHEVKGMMSPDLNGTVPAIHGREYLSITAYQKLVGKKNAKKLLNTYDGNIKRIIEAIDFDNHTFKGKPEGTKGFAKKSLKRLFKMLPGFFRAQFIDYNKAIEDYKNHAEELMQKIDVMSSESRFEDLANQAYESINVIMEKISLIFVGMIAEQTLKKIFKGDDIENELIALNMDLDGNPTSEMGKLLFGMASSSELKRIDSRELFVELIKKRAFNEKFLSLYDEFIKNHSFRGFKEIDVASTRIYEDIGILYDKLIAINTEENQILSVKERRDEAYNKLLALATEKGKRKKFIKATERLKATFGYREHPKYMIVYLLTKLHKIALEIGEKWTLDGRLESAYHIFDLKVSDITRGQEDSGYDLKSKRDGYLKGYESVKHVSDWPLVIDSRGKIYKPKLDLADGDIVGDSIAPGIVTGRAKVLKTPYEKPLNSGEILITRATEPSWTPIFTNAAGVVMEIGGPLQHGGIIAREYGIPCVSGLIGIMDILKDGDLIEVDGNNGVVRILENQSG